VVIDGKQIDGNRACSHRVQHRVSVAIARSQAFEEIAAACPQLILPLAVAPCGHNLMAELPAWTATFVCGALKDCLRADSRL
jgi:hypothetical protein